VRAVPATLASRAARRDRLPPGPRSRYPGEIFLAFRRDRLGFLQRLARDCGDVAHIRIGPQHVVLLSHPDHIRDVLVTNKRTFVKGRGVRRMKLLLGDGLLTAEGDKHLRQRRLAQPAFHRQRIAGYARTMVDYARRTAARWRAGDAVDAHDEMMRLTLAIAGKTLFDADVEAEASEIGDAVTTIIELFNVALLPFAELMDHLPLPWVRRFRRARERLDRTIYRIIAERRRSGADRGDLLSMLMLAADVDGDGGGMDDAQLRDEVMTLLLAGHETTANALSWTWDLLARHPEVERRLHEEVDAVLAAPDGGVRAATVDDVSRLPYARMVLAESMRLYPPAWTLGYQTLGEYEVAGYTLPARALVLMSQWVVHRDARFYDDPERFDPERWRPERAAERPRFAYFPFGGGTRQCIGEQFAWTEGVLVLATIARERRLRLRDEAPIVPEPTFTLRPRGGVKVRLERRR
jgi:cytochrome P450